MSKAYMMVFCSCPDVKTAEILAELLVENALAACVNIIPTIHSVFYWEGKLEKVDETLLMIKTLSARYSELEAVIQKNHPYDVPEIISVSIQQGLADYFRFIQHSLERTRGMCDHDEHSHR